MIGLGDLKSWIRDNIPGAAAFGSVLAFWADILINGGQLVLELPIILVSTVDIWLPVLSNLNRLSGIYSWIPAGVIETVFLSGVAITTVLYTVRLLDRLGSRLTD